MPHAKEYINSNSSIWYQKDFLESNTRAHKCRMDHQGRKKKKQREVLSGKIFNCYFVLQRYLDL